MILASNILVITTLAVTFLATTQVVQKATAIQAEAILERVIDPNCQCNYTIEGSWTQLLQFNAIIFEDFAASLGQNIMGRLAVGGDIAANGYLVNANSGEQCYGTGTVPWDKLALAVGGDINGFTRVNGHWRTTGAGQAIELIANCNSPANVDQEFPFASIQTLLNGYSQAFASSPPNYYLTDTDLLTPILGAVPSSCYDVITLQRCHNSSISNCIRSTVFSYPDGILLGVRVWSGPYNGYPNPDRLLIINVPVYDGEFIDITTGQPAARANVCNLIWNFYPVDINGNYLATGSFQLLRDTTSSFQGVILAPNANIVDGPQAPQGVFQGVIFANSYLGFNGNSIQNNQACNGYNFCAPPGQPVSPQPSGSIATSDTSIASSTITVSSTAQVSSTGPPYITESASSATSVSFLSSSEYSTPGLSSASIASTRTIGVSNTASNTQTSYLTSSPPPLNAQRCRGSHHHHKHDDEYENYDDEGHDWDDDEKKHDHKEHQDNNNDWNSDKRKRGESEDEVYWEDECEDSSYHSHDDDDNKWKDSSHYSHNDDDGN